MSDVINNVPELRFSGFNDFWRAIPFGDIYSFSATNSLSRASLNDTSGDYKNIHYGDIHTKFSTMLDAKNASIPYITDFNELSNSHAKSHCEVGDLVFADASEDYADVGKAIQIISLPSEPLVSGLHTFLAKDNHHQTALGFAGYLMSSYKVRRQIMTMAVGAKVLGISKTNLAKVLLDIPSKEEQQKIADFLSSVDKKIEQLTEKHRLLTEYKKGVMQQIFSQQTRFKDNQGNDYPEWENYTLGDVTSKVSVKNKDNRDLPVYSINNQQGFVPQGQQFEGVDSKSRNYDISMYKVIGKETFAYNPARINVGSLGFSGDLENIIISSLYVCFKTKNMVLDSFLLSFFDTFEFNKSVLRNVEGGVRDYLFYENFSIIKISLPCLEEQQKIANFLTEIDQKINQAWSTLDQTKAFKKGLLQKMFV